MSVGAPPRAGLGEQDDRAGTLRRPGHRPRDGPPGGRGTPHPVLPLREVRTVTTDDRPAVGRPGRPTAASARARAALDALEHLVGGMGTGLLALLALLWLTLTAVTCLLGVGLVLLPSALHAVRAVADRERARLSRWGPELIGPAPLPAGLRAALADRAVRREARWVCSHATYGLLLGLIGATLPLNAAHDTAFPLFWRLLPANDATAAVGWWIVRDWPGALLVSLIGLLWVAVIVACAPALARGQAWPGRRLLSPDPGADLALRVAELTATRAAALDAHATELRRVERALHDGTQNRIVAVTVLLGAARRALSRNPEEADAVLARAQDAAEQALAELRAVVRSILPPVLADRSLPDALTALAADCPVPCRVDADLPGRCAASVEATAYFAVAEALTNVARHSGAGEAGVLVRRVGDRLYVEIHDDGRGGAREHGGTGLTGIRRRVEAHDGTLLLASPPGGPTLVKVTLPCGS
ncbi:histidine kinase [Streptomyces calvus]|nr:histidine kinase [Streptomyces calvus]